MSELRTRPRPLIADPAAPYFGVQARETTLVLSESGRTI